MTNVLSFHKHNKTLKWLKTPRLDFKFKGHAEPNGKTVPSGLYLRLFKKEKLVRQLLAVFGFLDFFI